jgi:hypothetical protein
MHDKRGMLSAWSGGVRYRPGRGPGARQARRATVRLVTLTLSE